jgi:hypothetical protein
MAQYTINYLTGDTESVNAVRVGNDVDGGQYVFHDDEQSYSPVAFIPQHNVLSIIRQDDEQADA